eukprot:511131_1
MSWYYLDIHGTTTGPVPADFILSKYHFKTGQITSVTKIWNKGRGIEQWTELKRVYLTLAQDIISSVPQGTISNRLLLSMMNPYDSYIYKTKHCNNAPLPIGEAKVEIEYTAYLATMDELDEAHAMHIRESLILGMNHNLYGLEMALYKTRVGEDCFVYIPWRLAYGERGGMHGHKNPIPPKTDLLFHLMMHRIEQQGTTWQHNKVRFDEWSKMKSKWNSQKQSMNQLYVTDSYEMKPVQNTIKKLPRKPPSQKQILPMDTKRHNRQERWSSTATSGTKNSKPVRKKRRKTPKSKQTSPISTVPVHAAHRVSKSEGQGRLAQALTAKLQSKKLHRRNGTDYIPNSMGKSNSQSNSTSNSHDEEQEEKHSYLMQSEPEPLSVHSATRTVGFGYFSPRSPLTIEHGDSLVDWEQWLAAHKIPREMIGKLVEGGIVSWDELHAIEDDLEEVSKELDLTALHKIKLRALVRKLPLKPIPSDQSKRVGIEEEERFKPTLEKIHSDEDIDHSLPFSPITPLSPNTKIPLIKTDNEENMRQAMEETYDREVQIQVIRTQLNETRAKLAEKAVECKKLYELLRAQETQTCIARKYITDFVNGKVSRDDMKQLMMKDAEEMTVKRESVKRESVHCVTDDALFVVPLQEDLIGARQSFEVRLNLRMDEWLDSISFGQAQFELALSESIRENESNELFYKSFVVSVSIMFYDAALIRSQLSHPKNLLFQIPFTFKLLSIVATDDMACLHQFTRNFIEFEVDHDVSTFASRIAMRLMQSKNPNWKRQHIITIIFEEESAAIQR